MNNLSFELVTFFPWIENSLPDTLFPFSGNRPSPGFPILVRTAPRILLGPDGTLWLSRGKESIVRIRDSKPPELFPLSAAEVGTVAVLGPTLDAGIILLGQAGTSTVMARLSDTGELIWRKVDTPLHMNHPERAQLLVDLDGSAYLYASVEGQLFQINMDNGEAITVTEFTDVETSPMEVFLREENLFWLISLDGTRYWYSQDIATGEQQKIKGQGVFQSTFSWVRGPLPEGGALLKLLAENSFDLIWMESNGRIVARLPLAGMVRSGEGIAIATKEENCTTITQWNNGQAVNSVQVDHNSVPPSAQLIYADQDKYYLRPPIPLGGTAVITFAEVDWNGNTVVQLRDIKELQEKIGAIGTDKAVVEPDGSILLPGADSEGVYIVRIRGMPSGK